MPPFWLTKMPTPATPGPFEVPTAFMLLVGFTSIWNSFSLLPSSMPLLMRTSGP